MNCSKNYLFLHKDEWNRLKSAGAPIQESGKSYIQETAKTNEYLQSLIEKSQQWINSWPDSVQGHIVKREKQKEKDLKKNLAMIELFKKEQKNICKRNKCIEKAKQIIFDDSCYGKRLISALLESKTLEERAIQIEFQKKIKENALSEDLHHNAIEIENKEEERIKRKREKDEEVARVNKTIYLTQYENAKREKERQNQTEIEDLRRIAKLKEKEAVLEANQKIQFEQDLEQFKAERKKVQDRKAIRENEEERRIEIWRKYEDRKNTIMRRIHEKRFEKSQSTEHYELVKKLNDDEKKRYDEFVNKGITTHTRRLKIKEEEDNQKKLKERKNQYLLAQSNKKLENAKRIDKIDKNISACDRQCLLSKCKNAPGIKQFSREQDIVALVPSYNRLVKNLKIREGEPSPWGSLSATHAQFARNAENTLQECRYKHAARKVVDEYRQLHGLTPQDLPIANYI